MTKRNEELISKLELLSRLHLTESEKIKIGQDLNAIVSMFDKLVEVNTDGVEPLRHISGNINTICVDKVRGELTNAEALKNVTTVQDGFIAVPNFLKPKKH